MEEKQPFETPHEGDESTRAARRRIDDDINKLKLKIQFLRRDRNKLSPISVLPPEVLSKIFIFLRDSFPGVQYRDYQVRWICVGHVCHHWREVVLSCPSLWSVPVFTRPNLAQEMIHRSKMAALTIMLTAGAWTPRTLEKLENAMTQISRIQSIHLGLGVHSEKLKAIFSSLSQPAPLLEKIYLSDATTSASDKPLSFPAEALADAPRLRSIDFGYLDFSWESAVFKHGGVTVLRLRTTALNDTSTMDQMMDALGHLPNLHILELSSTIPSHTTSSGNKRPLEFKFLERLMLVTRAVDCIFLLRHLHYPSRAMVRLHCSSAEIEDCTTVLSLVGQNLRSSQSVEAGTPHPPAVIRSAELTSVDVRAVGIIFFDGVERIKHRYSFDDFDPIIYITFDSSNITSRNNDRLLTNVNDYFDMSSLEALFINWSFTHDQIHMVRDTLGKLPKLKFIHVSESLPEICLAICENPDEVPAEKTEETKTHYSLHGRKSQRTFHPITVFRALRSILIKHVDFRRHRYPENMESLVNMLMKRSNMNAPIDGLTIEGCRGVSTVQKRRLGELVVDLEIDRKEIDVGELRSVDDWDMEDYSDEDEDDEDDSDDYYDDPYYDTVDAFGWFPF